MVLLYRKSIHPMYALEFSHARIQLEETQRRLSLSPNGATEPWSIFFGWGGTKKTLE